MSRLGASIITAAASISGIVGAASVPVQADPADFTEESRVTGLNFAVAGAWLDDGRLLVLSTTGELTITSPSTGAKSLLGTIAAVDVTVGRGATGIVTHPGFADNGQFFVYYTHAASQRLRVDRFVYSDTGTTLMASQTNIWQSPGTLGTFRDHFGGGMAFGADGYLYLSIGDGNLTTNSATLDNPFGKILRIDTSGVAAPDNPFVDVPGALDEVWAYGLRNPFRITFDDWGSLLIADVGGAVRATAREEVNVGAAGADYGWASCEGPVAGNTCRAGTVGPIYDYDHFSDSGAVEAKSITGGEIFHSAALPSWLEGAYIFGDFVQSDIRFVRFGPDHQPTSEGIIRAVAGNPTWVSQGPDGHIYYIDYGFSAGASQVKRVRYTGVLDHAPQITAASATPTTGPSPLQVQFTGSATDDDGDAITYSWTFGDGMTSAVASPLKVYQDAGTYTARLTATSDGTSVYSDLIPIEVTEPGVGSVFVALESCVVGDSSGTGPLIGGSVTTFDVTGTLPPSQGAEAADCGVPDEATAVFAEIAAIDPIRPGNLRASATGVVPSGGIVNFADTTPELENSNAVAVPLAAAGTMDIGVNCGDGCTEATTDTRVTVLGYFRAPTGAPDELSYRPITPCTAFDSRQNQGADGAFVGAYDAGEQRTFDIVGTFPASQGGGSADCGVPASAQAVMINLVAVNSAIGGKLAVGPGGSDPDEPVVAHAPFNPTMNNSNAVIVPVDALGRVVVEAQGAGGAAEMVDARGVVLGYLVAAEANAGGLYHPLDACTAFDTRTNQGAGGVFAGSLQHNDVRTFSIAGTFAAEQGGGNTDCGVPLGASAVLVNLIAVNPTLSGNLQIAAAGTTATGGVLNFALLESPLNNANAVVVPLSGPGQVSVKANLGGVIGQPGVDVRGVVLGYLD